MRILVIEDEAEIASFIKKGLRAENFIVETASEAEQGLFLVKSDDYDAIILDIRLMKGFHKEESGIEVCRQIRMSGKTMPILILTVKGEIKTKIEAFDAGADDYLTKPFAIEELIARLRALLRRGETLKGDILQVNDLVLDIKIHKVMRNGKEILLSKKEFVLLEYLIRNKGVVLTRSMILEHVWDMNADPFTNTVDVHIRFLRKKIDGGFKKKLIKTIFGYGYKIE